tara:strand:+ start:3786 stop:4652 length:867 start_codon:yes stop_codon:yes gene_type:complete
MAKSRHNKIRNTGLLYEFLLRQLTVDVLNGVDKSKTLDIIKEFFSDKKQLGIELQLYNSLLNKTFKSDKKADFLITETINSYNKINRKELKREKYELMKRIKESYDVNKLFSSKISNYKVHASIYKLFEQRTKLSPEEKTETYFTILENITDSSKKERSVKISDLAKYKKVIREDEDLRILSYKILLEKFNKKYKSLNNNQKDLLKAYINNISNTNSLKEYIQKEVPTIKKQIKKNISEVKDKVVKIKLRESISLLENLVNGKSKLVDDKSVIRLMRYYELVEELNEG